MIFFRGGRFGWVGDEFPAEAGRLGSGIMIKTLSSTSSRLTVAKFAEQARRPSTKPRKIGGRDRVRTCDLMLAKHALSQLSYTPTVGVPFILKHFSQFQNPFPRI